MPQFCEANVGHLVGLFGKVDELETGSVPQVANIGESKNAGYEMIGTTGLSCIACHEFSGQKAGDMIAPDIGHLTERLKKNWFYLYMRQPSHFHPTVGSIPAEQQAVPLQKDRILLVALALTPLLRAEEDLGEMWGTAADEAK